MYTLLYLNYLVLTAVEWYRAVVATKQGQWLQLLEEVTTSTQLEVHHYQQHEVKMMTAEGLEMELEVLVEERRLSHRRSTGLPRRSVELQTRTSASCSSSERWTRPTSQSPSE